MRILHEVLRLHHEKNCRQVWSRPKNDPEHGLTQSCKMYQHRKRKSRLWAASKNAAWNSSCLVSHHHRSHLPLIYMLSECNMESFVQMLIGSRTRFPFPWIADVSMLLLQWDCHESSSHWYWGRWKLHFHPLAFLLVGNKEKKQKNDGTCLWSFI